MSVTPDSMATRFQVNSLRFSAGSRPHSPHTSSNPTRLTNPGQFSEEYQPPSTSPSSPFLISEHEQRGATQFDGSELRDTDMHESTSLWNIPPPVVPQDCQLPRKGDDHEPARPRVRPGQHMRIYAAAMAEKNQLGEGETEELIAFSEVCQIHSVMCLR